MHPSTCEDYLEAIHNTVPGNQRPVTFAEIAEALGVDPAAVEATVPALAQEGYLTLHGDGSVLLTEKGRERAAKVVRKHSVLQCFLTEMLGIDTDAASREACTLEHEISDETIDRLSSYLDCRKPGHAPRRRCGRAAASLLDFDEGDTLRVTMLKRPGCNRRLMDLGILPGEVVELRRKLPNRSVMVRVKGCDIAISPEIAESIFVEPSR
ncbi:iron transporter FeoA [Methanoculleus taiwanensis]|uniref:Iron transporter FeoA n=1 Tax=Methanoculleus taiwanensis TaxID=1550565 RepID=A0A498GWT1_9EURY|nr:metal-dependent transcriptional regulator [Methanoculleus taiwanensis]RXE55162.1 iron transporter FeoA [Methanoculleus taiwanensis]